MKIEKIKGVSVEYKKRLIASPKSWEEVDIKLEYDQDGGLDNIDMREVNLKNCGKYDTLIYDSRTRKHYLIDYEHLGL